MVLLLEEGKSRSNIREKFFTVWVVRHYNQLPREAVDSTSLEVFRTGLDKALSNLV